MDIQEFYKQEFDKPVREYAISRQKELGIDPHTLDIKLEEWGKENKRMPLLATLFWGCVTEMQEGLYPFIDLVVKSCEGDEYVLFLDWMQKEIRTRLDTLNYSLDLKKKLKGEKLYE